MSGLTLSGSWLEPVCTESRLSSEDACVSSRSGRAARTARFVLSERLEYEVEAILARVDVLATCPIPDSQVRA